MNIERAFVSGGRWFTDYDRIEADLRALLPLGLNRVAEGASNGGGADWLAHDAWRNITGRSTERYRVDSAIDGWHRGAPRNRNIRMVEAEVRLAQLASETIVGLFYPDPDSRGTWHCLREACNRGITCIIWAPFFEVYDFMGEDGIKPGIYIDGPKGNIIRIDDQRRESHGRASDGGWASLTLIEGSAVPHSSRFAVCVFDQEVETEGLMEVLGDLAAQR